MIRSLRRSWSANVIKIVRGIKQSSRKRSNVTTEEVFDYVKRNTEKWDPITQEIPPLPVEPDYIHTMGHKFMAFIKNKSVSAAKNMGREEVSVKETNSLHNDAKSGIKIGEKRAVHTTDPLKYDFDVVEYHRGKRVRITIIIFYQN